MKLFKRIINLFRRKPKDTYYPFPAKHLGTAAEMLVKKLRPRTTKNQIIKNNEMASV